MQVIRGLPPLIHHTVSRVLILGSMPSVESLAQQAYYAHPRNQFWQIMYLLFGIDKALSYRERCERLVANGIAVWDVLAECLRQGSLDSAIIPSSVVPNDIAQLLRRNPQINLIFFNGRKAEQMFKRHVAHKVATLDSDIAYRCLPSTSPANAGLSLQEKLKHWRVIASSKP